MANETEDSMSDLPPARPSLKAFAAFADHIGIRVVEWELDRCVIEFDVEDHLLNGTGVLHGGCMSTVIDTALAHAAIYCTVPENYRSGATVTLTVNFILPVKKGNRVTVESKKTGGGRTMFMSVAEARDQDGRILATGQGIGRYRDGCHLPEGLPRPDGVPDGKSPGRFS
ncbi:MAG: hotdog fold thioesterase [Alphaproteobacteria bacterium]|nr:hotdog fold thioesterase [Alphaproteobacteria bacterium]